MLPPSHLHLLCLVAGLRIIPQVRGLKGDSGCGKFMCVNATVNSDIITYEMTALKEPLGWIAIGFGRKMRDTHMVIMWPNADGSTTLSQRQALDHSEPLPVEYPPRLATVIAPRRTSWHPENSTTLAFQIPVNKTLLASNDPTERLIWAYSKIRPDKSHYSLLTQHFSAGYLRLNLNKDLSNAAAAYEDITSSGTEQNPSKPSSDHVKATAPSISYGLFERHEVIIVAHGILVSIGFLVLLPMGSLVARWGRTLWPNWFKAHRTLNMMLALPIITLGWILGPVAVIDRQASHLFDAHQVCGVLLVALYYLQVSLGRYIHRRRSESPPNARLHPPSNLFHIGLGLAVITLAFFQIRSGMEEWRLTTGRSQISHWCHDLWNVWVVIVPLLYLSGFVMLRRQFYQERNGMNLEIENYVVLSESPPTSHLAFEVSHDGAYKNGSVDMIRETAELESAVPLLTSSRRP